MKRTHLLGTAAVVVALTLFSATPSFAKGGGGHGGHGGGHGGHAHGGHGHRGHGGHGGHSHGSGHHGGFAHHNGGHGHSGHHFANHSFAHNHAGWGHGYGHGWGYGGHGWGYGGHGWGYGGYGWGWRNRGLGYWGGWGPGYVATRGVGPSYYYSNTVTEPVFPPVNTTVMPPSVTELIEPVTPLVPPAPVDPNQIGSALPVDDATSGTPVPGPAPGSAS